MSIANKILICLCCSETACCVASCYDEWAAVQACGLAQLNCGACCWTICAPLCHSFALGDFGTGMGFCVKGIKFCLYSTVIGMVAPIDGCINCIFYAKKNFESGVSGMKDMTQNCKFIGKKIQQAFQLKGSNEPQNTFGTYTP